MSIPNDTKGYDTIAIQASEVPGDLTDYIVYLDLSQLSSDWWSNVDSNGDTIRITSGDGSTEYAREIVQIDTSGQTGEVHFLLDGTLSSTTDTDIRVYCGGSASGYSETDTYGKHNVWPSEYKGVWHLNDFNDSTGNSNDGSGNGGVTAGDATGQLGSATNFDGSDDYIDLSSLSSFDDKKTVSSWVNFDTVPSGDAVFVHSRDTDNDRDDFILYYNDGTELKGILTDSNGDVYETTYSWTPNTGQWYYITLVGNSDIELFLDGSSVASSSSTIYNNTSFNAPDGLTIGSHATIKDYFDGSIDETRIAKTLARTSNWITTEYNNQSDPSTFFGSASWTARVTINATLGTVTLSSYQASVLQDTTIDTALATVSLAGKQATVLQGVTIFATAPTVAFTGYAADITNALIIEATCPNITLAGKQATILQGTVVSATAGSLTISGKQAGIYQGTLIDASLGQVTLTGLTADILKNTVIDQTSPPNVSLVGKAATVEVIMPTYKRNNPRFLVTINMDGGTKRASSEDLYLNRN